MAKENTTVYAILGLLTHEAMSGYDIKKRIDISINKFWDIGYGQIYPTLRIMEKDGDVTKKTTTGKGPDRIVYYITEHGRAKLTAWLSNPAGKEYVKYEILLKLFFGSLLPVEENIKKIKEFHIRSERNLKTMELFKGSLEKVLGESADHHYYLLTALFGVYVYKAYMDWADEAELLLQKLISKGV
ncbi:MAG: PadR family transcriptional regulator [Ruminiclostridium sp.]|nr:PadR family transcriptional regulator [Ruminiclostridium sp.]